MTEAQPATNPQAWWLAIGRGQEYRELVERAPRGGTVRPAIEPEGGKRYVELQANSTGLSGPF